MASVATAPKLASPFMPPWEALVGGHLDMIVVLCTLFAVYLGLGRKRNAPSRTTHEHADERAGEREDVAVLTTQRRHTDGSVCVGIDAVHFMSKQGAVRRGANRIEKAKLLYIAKHHTTHGNYEEMVQGIGQFEKRSQLALGMKDYHDLIVHLARGGDPTTAHRWLRRSMEVGYRPLPGAFSTVISSYGKKGAIAQAMDVFEDMNFAGVGANTVTYNAIMDAWARAGDAGRAQKWMKRMFDAGLRPNVVSFSILMSACAAAGLPEDLDAWFALSQDLGIELNAITFTAVVTAHSRKGDVVNAVKWMEAMVEQGVAPDIRCCMGLVATIFQASRIDFVDTLIGHMRSVGLPPDGIFFSKCIVLACRGGHTIQAQRWADECAAARCRLTCAATQAIVEAGLKLPVLGDGDQAYLADGEAGMTTGPGDALERTDNYEKEVQGSRIKGIQAARAAAIGKRYSGTIKDFVPGQFGYITCAAVHDLFQRDVFLGRHDNPEQLTKGQRVSFTLRVDNPCCLPRASNVLPERLCKPR